MDSVTAASSRVAGRSGPGSLRPVPLLVGRTLEQVFLREELAAVLADRGRLVLVGGEAGIGKTALARDLAAVATARGIRVLDGSCYDLSNTPPYGPWRELFEACEREPKLPVPPAPFAGGRLEPVADQAALFADVRRFFAELASDRPALILLEDLHWADPASLELLRHLTPRLRHWPILLLATYRGDELTRRHPFAVQLPALVREADGLRLDLHRLDQSALRSLVAYYRLPAADEARLVAYLDRHADGNPLFATELLRALREETLLRPAGDGWMLAALERVVVPQFLRQVIEGRVSRHGEATRRPLEIAAVIGQEVPLALWGDVAGLDGEALLTIVEQALDAHLLEADPDGTHVRFVHALTREALYAGIAAPRRRLWHRATGEALAAGPRPDPDAVAYHFQVAGDPRACEWLLAAGERAQRAYAWLTAAERFRAAATLLEGVEGQERTRDRLACRIAYLLRFSDPAGAIAAIDDAAALAGQIDDAFWLAETDYLRGLLLCYLGQFHSGVANMIAGFDTLAALPPQAARVPAALQSWFASALPGVMATAPGSDEYSTHQREEDDPQLWRGAAFSRFLASAGHLRTALDDCERFDIALAGVSETSGDIRASIAFNAHGLGVALAGLGRPDEAHAVFARARAGFIDLGHHAMVAFTLLNELADIGLTYDAARPDVRRELAVGAEAALDRTGGALRPGVSPRLVWLRCLVLDGRWAEADAILLDHPDPGNAYLRREIITARAVLARHRGDPEQAWAEIRTLLPDGPETEPGNLIHQEGLFLQRLAAALCLDAGDLPAARSWLTAHDRWLAWSESVLGWTDGQIAWARYHRAAGDDTPARTIANGVLTAQPDQPLVRLAAHRLLGKIETAAKNHAAAEEHFEASLSIAAACDAPFERALTLLTLAELRLTTRPAGEVTALLDEIRGICGPLGAMPTLALADAVEARLTLEPTPRFPAGLTAREVEILRLLPRGLSTPEIAAELFISPRTVQTHLTNLYAKLGVGGRAEAITFAVGHGLV